MIKIHLLPYMQLNARNYLFILRGSPYETPRKKILFNDFRLSRKKRYTSMIFYIYFKLLLNNIVKKMMSKLTKMAALFMADWDASRLE